MPTSDTTLICRDCNQRFVFTAGEQQYYAQHGLAHQPSRCPSCRQTRKAAQANGTPLNGAAGASSLGPRQMYEVVCSACGRVTEVPFQPNASKPVYCRDCYEDRRGGRLYGAPAGYRSSTRF